MLANILDLGPMAFLIIVAPLLYLFIGYATFVGFGDHKNPLAQEYPGAAAVMVILWPLALAKIVCDIAEETDER